MSASRQREVALQQDIRALEIALAREQGRSAALEERCKALEARPPLDITPLLARGRELIGLWKQFKGGKVE